VVAVVAGVDSGMSHGHSRGQSRLSSLDFCHAAFHSDREEGTGLSVVKEQPDISSPAKRSENPLSGHFLLTPTFT